MIIYSASLLSTKDLKPMHVRLAGDVWLKMATKLVTRSQRSHPRGRRFARGVGLVIGSDKLLSVAPGCFRKLEIMTGITSVPVCSKPPPRIKSGTKHPTLQLSRLDFVAQHPTLWMSRLWTSNSASGFCRFQFKLWNSHPLFAPNFVAHWSNEREIYMTMNSKRPKQKSHIYIIGNQLSLLKMTTLVSLVYCHYKGGWLELPHAWQFDSERKSRAASSFSLIFLVKLLKAY